MTTVDPEYRHLLYIANENVCIDCMEGDHETCRHEGGYLDDEDNSVRCGCHLTDHALDNRPGQGQSDD